MDKKIEGASGQDASRGVGTLQEGLDRFLAFQMRAGRGIFCLALHFTEGDALPPSARDGILRLVDQRQSGNVRYDKWRLNLAIVGKGGIIGGEVTGLRRDYTTKVESPAELLREQTFDCVPQLLLLR